MFNSIVLDTVIGMVFIFLLYSLLATILGELVANWLGLRARMLRQAIERMLNDGYEALAGKDPLLPPNPTSWDRILLFMRRLKKWLTPMVESLGGFFLYEVKEFKSSFAGRFYSQPSIKYLTKEQKKGLNPFGKKKPSYIRTDNFSDTLIQVFRGKGIGDTDIQKIRYCLKYNTLHIQPETLEHISNLLRDSGEDLEKFRKKLNSWYDEMMERLGGWFKRKIQLILFLIGLIIAFTFNVDTIQIAKKLGKDKNAREQMVQMANSAAKSESAISTAKERAGDSTVSDSLLRESYRQVKEATDDASQILGLGWDLSNLVKPSIREIPNSRLILCWNYAGMRPKFDTAIAGPLGDSSKSYRLDVLLKDNLSETEGYRENLKKNERDNDLQATLSARIRENDHAMYRFLAAMNYFNSSHFSGISKIGYVDKNHSVIRGERHYSIAEKVWYIICQPFRHPLMLLGFIVTALAISLGSNFWFDLLKKLVSIRGAGVNPDENKPKTGGEPNPFVPEPSVVQEVTVSPDMEKGVPAEMPSQKIEAVIADVSKLYSGIQGITSIEKGFIKVDGVKKEAIEIYSSDPDIRSKTPAIEQDSYSGFPVNFIITAEAVAHAIRCGDTIANKNTVNGIGTAGCFVKRADTGKVYLVSCWHVLKGDTNWTSGAGSFPMITDKDGMDIAKITDGALTDRFDAGFAEMLSKDTFNNKPLNIRFTWREVTAEDAVNETRVSFIGASKGSQEAVIYKNVAKKSLKYPDGANYLLQDLFTITAYDEKGNPRSPSAGGDSGSVVVDANGYPLGLLIGGDDAFSYVAKFSNILSVNSIYREYSLII